MRSELKGTPSGTPSVRRAPTCTTLWAIQDVADFLQIPAATLYQWRHRGEGPPAMLLGRHLRFDPDQVRAWAGDQQG